MDQTPQKGFVYEWSSAGFDEYYLYFSLKTDEFFSGVTLHRKDHILMLEINEEGYYVLAPTGVGWIKKGNGYIQHVFKFFC